MPTSPCRPRVAPSAAIGAALAFAAASAAWASSHREAPFITSMPKVDATDFYLFRSYEPGREGHVTFIANDQPLQDAYGGPNYFALDPNAPPRSEPASHSPHSASSRRCPASLTMRPASRPRGSGAASRARAGPRP